MKISIFSARFSITFILLSLTCQQIDRARHADESKPMSVSESSMLLMNLEKKLSPTLSPDKSTKITFCILFPDISIFYSRLLRSLFLSFLLNICFPSKKLPPLKNLAAPPKNVPAAATNPAKIIAATLMLAKF